MERDQTVIIGFLCKEVFPVEDIHPGLRHSLEKAVTACVVSDVGLRLFGKDAKTCTRKCDLAARLRVP
jgi:hypothetical protein